MINDPITRHFFNGFIRLHILYHAAKEPVYGAEITEELVRHGYRISQGTLYPTLHQMEELGYIRCKTQYVSGRRRKYYRRTVHGRKALAEAKKKLLELVTEVIEDEDQGFRDQRKTPPKDIGRSESRHRQMNPIVFALRHPISIMIAIVAVVVGSVLAVTKMKVDIFPSLNLPVIYVCQPYGGMDPGQMEGLITNYYEYHFLYISGIHHVESKNIQGMSLMKLFFHPGTDMAQAMAETIQYVNRSRAFMPPGTVGPFVMRFDTGSVPVGYLVLSSDNPNRTIGEIQDQGLFKVRPMFASLPGVSAPPPFGGNARTIVLRVDPDRLRAYKVSPEEVITALTSGNTISPSGNIRVKDRMPIVPANAMVLQPKELGNITIRPGSNVYLRDIAVIEDATDVPSGYALVNGRRAVYILVTKRADASTLAVVNEVKANLRASR